MEKDVNLSLAQRKTLSFSRGVEVLTPLSGFFPIERPTFSGRFAVQQTMNYRIYDMHEKETQR
jgi:hypothetical protein